MLIMLLQHNAAPESRCAVRAGGVLHNTLLGQHVHVRRLVTVQRIESVQHSYTDSNHSRGGTQRSRRWHSACI